MDNEIMIGGTRQDELMEFSPDNIMVMAKQADQLVSALNRIMKASLAVTTEKDWTLIGGTPYLQESGATKVARLFGVSWKMGEPTQETNPEGYRTFIFKGEFSMKGQTIEAEGSRSMRDDFFSKGKNGTKKPDEIDVRDVRMAAYTNFINNGIKRLIPGLRNIDVSTLEEAGLDVGKIKGYSFKDGAKGGASKTATDFKCAHCDADITSAEASYSESKYSQKLCRKCQDLAKAGGLNDGGTNQ